MRAWTVPQRNPNQRRHVMPHGRAPITTYMHGTVTKPAVSGRAPITTYMHGTVTKPAVSGGAIPRQSS